MGSAVWATFAAVWGQTMFRFASCAAVGFAATFIAATCAGAQPGAPDVQIEAPRNLIPNFDAMNLAPVLDDLGARYELRRMEDGRPFLAVSFDDDFAFNLVPTACLSSDFSRCIGVNIVAIYSAGGLNAQTISAFNQSNAFASVGWYEREKSLFLLRYDIADYGIPRGNLASSLAQFIATAARLQTEIETRPKTVSLYGYADDVLAGSLNRKGLAAMGARPKTAGAHEASLSEATGLIEALFQAGAAVNTVDGGAPSALQ